MVTIYSAYMYVFNTVLVDITNAAGKSTYLFLACKYARIYMNTCSETCVSWHTTGVGE